MTNCHWQNNNSQPGWIVIRTRLKGENGLTRLKGENGLTRLKGEDGLTRLKGEDGLLFIRTTTKGRALLWSGCRWKNRSLKVTI